MAENILAEKLCRCIQVVKNQIKHTEKRAIGICKKCVPKKNMRRYTEKQMVGICKASVLKKKKLHSYTFKCKGKPQFLNKKGTRRKLMKRTKRFTLHVRKCKIKKI